MDEKLINFIKVLADKDVNEAIINRDFKKFLNSCIEKKIISSDNMPFESDYYKKQIDQLSDNEEIKYLLEKIDINNIPVSLKSGTTGTTDALWGVLFLGAFVAIAVSVIVVASIGFWVAVSSYNAKDIDAGSQLLNGNLSAIDVFLLKNGYENTFIAVDSFIESAVNEMIQVLKEISPECFDAYSETEIRNLLKINIINNIGK